MWKEGIRIDVLRIRDITELQDREGSQRMSEMRTRLLFGSELVDGS
jgi:hypothetical protein